MPDLTLPTEPTSPPVAGPAPMPAEPPDRLDWEASIEAPPLRPVAALAVKLVRVDYGPPAPVDDPREP